MNSAFDVPSRKRVEVPHRYEGLESSLEIDLPPVEFRVAIPGNEQQFEPTLIASPTSGEIP